MDILLSPQEIRVIVQMQPLLRGKLYAAIKEEESTWYLDGRILTFLLLKANRRGHYKDGCSNATTFWPSVLRHPNDGELLQVKGKNTGKIAASCAHKKVKIQLV